MSDLRVWPDQEPELLPLFPLLYVAWSDLELEDPEIDAIRTAAGCLGSTSGVCNALGTWLDPDRPPTAPELARMQTWIRSPTPLVEPPAAVREVLEDAVGVSAEQARKAQLAASYVYAWPPPELPTPSFDTDALASVLDGPYPEERAEVRAMLEDPSFTHRYGLSTEAQRAQVLTWLWQLAEAGFGARAYPGVATSAGSMGPFLAAFETLATFDLGLWVKAGVQFGLFGGSIFFLGTASHHARLKDVAAGRLLGCFAMSETGHGSNVRQLGTRARYDAATQEFVIHTPTPGDRKDYVGNAGQHGTLATVFAQLEVGDAEYGVHAFLVPIRDATGQPMPGVTLVDNGEKMGLNGIDNGRIAFDEVRVPRTALLDKFGAVDADGEYTSPIASPSRRFFTMLGTLVGGRVSVANAALSASKVALAIAIRYSLRRRQFGAPGEPEMPIASYPAHRRRLMPRLARTVALDLALEDLTRQYETLALVDTDKRELEALAAGMKALTTAHCTDTVQACREACGGAGYLAVNRFAALKADSDVFTTFEGDNTVLLQLMAKSLLTGFRQQFTDDRFAGVMRFIADRAQATLHRLNPLETRATGSEALREPSFQMDLLRHRTQDQVVRLAGRLQGLVKDGRDATSAFNAAQNEALDLARSHLEQVVVERIAEVEGQAEPGLATLLGRVRSLTALHAIESDVGWFLEHGYVASPQAGAVRREVDQLCDELAQESLGIVEAFRLPRSAVAAPIADLEAAEGAGA